MTENNQKTPLSTVQINAQYIKDFSFEAPNMPFSLLELKSAPEININIDLNAGKTQNEKVFTVDLALRLNAKTKENDKTLFLCELVYGALVTLDVPEASREPMLMVEIPHLIFPYARAVIANTIREAGLPSLQISPIDFAGLYRAKLAEKEKAKA
ncbi:MAG: protein-export chaperone SecB [Alphaproteobacteria bacterium]|nr:protein-export chaperone SecB [Alphaproteobacteria bacterium]